MKSKVILIAAFLLLISFNFSSKETDRGNALSRNDSLTVLATPELYSLTSEWAEEYCRLNPGEKIRVIGSSFPKRAVMERRDYIAFIPGNYMPYEEMASVWKVVVGRDVVVPVVNAGNPFTVQLGEQGVSAEKLAAALVKPEIQNWAQLLQNTGEIPLNYYRIKEGGVDSEISSFLGIKAVSLSSIPVKNSKELVSAVKADIYSLGFCRLTDILDSTGNSFTGNIRLLPVDRNGNGRIDYSEKIYDDPEMFSRAVWIGKYPRTLYTNIYCISSSQPGEAGKAAFIGWVLNAGQKLVLANGYSDLTLTERQSNLDKLAINDYGTSPPVIERSKARMVLLIFFTLFSVFVLLDYWVRRSGWRKTKIQEIPPPPLFFNESSVKSPGGLYYDKSHTWAFMESDGLVKIGVDDFLQHITGPLTQVKLQSEAGAIKKGEPLLILIRKGKQLILRAPVSGIIREQNREVLDRAEIVNVSPYSEGWICKIEPSKWARQMQFLLMIHDYRQFLKKEFSRLKDFLAEHVKPRAELSPGYVLQDGGELRDNLLSDLDPGVWEEFQANFLEHSKPDLKNRRRF